MTELLNFTNLGVLKTKIPNELFLKILAESQSSQAKDIKQTGLESGLGVVKHIQMTDTYDELSEFVLNLANEYEWHYKYLNQINSAFGKRLTLRAGIPWFNYQKKHEHVPNHHHDGVLSYSGWVKIPYNIEEEHTNNLRDNATASTFEFRYNATNGMQMLSRIPIDKTWEGYIIMFPSNLQHCVYPFYTSDDTRISFSGNILFDSGEKE